MRRVQFLQPVYNSSEETGSVPPSTPDQSSRELNPESNSRRYHRPTHTVNPSSESAKHTVSVGSARLQSLEQTIVDTVPSSWDNSSHERSHPIDVPAIRLSHTFTAEEIVQQNVMKSRLDVISLKKLPRVSVATQRSISSLSQCLVSPVYSLSPQLLKSASTTPTNATGTRLKLNPVTARPKSPIIIHHESKRECAELTSLDRMLDRNVPDARITNRKSDPVVSRIASLQNFGLKFIPPGCELALQVYATVCSILEEQDHLRLSYTRDPDVGFPSHLLHYNPVPHKYFSVYNLKLCDGNTSLWKPKPSSWAESEQMEDVVYRVTVTESGAVFKTLSKKFTQFMTLEQFRSDIKAFVMVRALTLFGNFRLVKSLQLWKRQARYQVFCRHFEALELSLRWHSPSLISCIQFTHTCIFDVRERLDRFQLWNDNLNSSDTPALQDDLPGNELQHCDTQIQAFILSCKNWFSDMLEDIASHVQSCSREYLSTRDEPQVQFKLTLTIETVRAIRHEDLIKRLLPFVKVCSYMIESAKMQFCITSLNKFASSFSSSSHQDGKPSLFNVRFVSTDAKLQCDSQHYVMHPSKHSVCQWYRTRHMELMRCFLDPAILTSRDDILNVFIKRNDENRQLRRSWLLSSDCVSHDFQLLMNQPCSEILNSTLETIAQGMDSLEQMKLDIIETPLECRSFLANLDLLDIRKIYTSLFTNSSATFLDNLSGFNHLINRILSCQSTIHRCFVDSSLISIGWCTLNMVIFLRELDEYASSQLRDVESCVCECFDSTLYSSEEQLAQLHRELSSRDISPANFAVISRSLANAPERLFNLEELLDRLQNVHLILRSSELSMPFDPSPLLKRQSDQVEQIHLDIEICGEWHSMNYSSVVKALNEDQQSLYSAVEGLRESLASSNPSKLGTIGSDSDFENLMSSLDFFDGVSSALVVRGNDLESHRNIILSHDTLLSISRPDVQVATLISQYKMLWIGARRAHQFWVKNKWTPIAAVSIDMFVEEIGKMQQLKSRCEEFRDIVSLPVYHSFTSVLQTTCNIVPLAQMLQSKNLNDSHWSIISRIVAGAYLVTWASDSSATEGLGRMSTETNSMDIQRGVALTLNDCINWELCIGSVFQRIADVVLESEVQHKLESSFQEQTLMWSRMSFQFEFRDKKIVFCSLSTILGSLNESLSSLQLLLSSRFCSLFLDECHSLSLNLSRVVALLEVWSEVQELCIELEKLYSSIELKTFCSRGFPIFERESRRWISCVEVVANRPSLFYACGLCDLSGDILEDTDIYDIKKEHAISLRDGFLAARHEAVLYLDSKRLFWPRLFALSNETLMLAVSQPVPSRNSFWPQLFLSVFSSIEMVTSDYSAGLSSVTLTDRTKISLNVVLNFSEKIESWLHILHKAISHRVLESIKTVLLDFGFHGVSDSAVDHASLPPAKGRSQIISICDWAIWCRRISQAFSDCILPSSGFGEKKSQTTFVANAFGSNVQQISVIKNLEAVCSQAVSEIECCTINVLQPHAMNHHILLQVQRIILCIWVQDLIRDIISSSGRAVIDSRCWAWESVIRYHVEQNSEFLTVHICDRVTDFGYEVITQAGGFNTFPIVCMTDRMRLVCSLAISAAACIPCTLVGPVSSGRAMTISLLASMYGFFVATLPCCSSLEVPAIDRFLDLAFHSGQCSTVCFIKDIDSLEPRILSHLCSSLLRINDIICDKVRSPIDISSSIWFLCCTGSFDRFLKGNSSHMSSTFGRTIRVIEIDRLALTACLLRAFGFSLAEVISQKLHVFYDQISASINCPQVASYLTSAAVVSQVLHAIILSWSDFRFERDSVLRPAHNLCNDFNSSEREIQCVLQSLSKVVLPLLSALGDTTHFSSIASACFGIQFSAPSLPASSPSMFPSSFEQCRLLFLSIGIDCDHHLQTALNIWNALMNCVLPCPFLIFVGSDGSGRNLCLSLFEVISVHFSQSIINRFSVCSHPGVTEKLLQRILEQVHRSPSISFFNVPEQKANDSELKMLRSSKPLPADVTSWFIVYLQSCFLAQNFGHGRISNISEKIRNCAQYLTIESGVSIIQKGTYNFYVYFIVSGNFSLTCNDKEFSVSSGHVLGDFTAINGLNNICDVVSTTKSSLIMVPSHIFRFGTSASSADADNQETRMSKTSHCLIVADLIKCASSIDCLINNSDYFSYTTWGAENNSWQRTMRLSTSIVIKCNDIHNDTPASLSRCTVVPSPCLNIDSQISIALDWLRHHSFSTTVGDFIFDYVASLFHNHVSCCLSFFLKLEHHIINVSSFAKTASQLLVCVCASFGEELGKCPSMRSLEKCTCNSNRFYSVSSSFVSHESFMKLPSVLKMIHFVDDSVPKCSFCSFPLSPSLRPFAGDVNSVDIASIRRFWASMVAFCVLHSARGLLPFDFSILNLFEKHAKNGFVDVIFRSSSVFDWCVSTVFPFMTTLNNSESISQADVALLRKPETSTRKLIQDLFVPTNYSRNATWLAHCWLRGGFSSLIFDGPPHCGKSVMAQHVAELFSSDSNSAFCQFSARSVEHMFSHPLEYFATRRNPDIGLAPYLHSIHIYSVQQTRSVIFIDDVHEMPLHVHVGIRSLQALGVLWFFASNRRGISNIASLVDIPANIIMTKNSAYDRTAAINNFALIISYRDFSNHDNLKAVYSSLAKISLQSAGFTSDVLNALCFEIGNACSSLHILFQGTDADFPLSRVISQGLQGVLECGDFLSSKNEAVRVFCHEMLHAIFDRTTIPLLDSDNASFLHPQLKSDSPLTFPSVFRTISSCFLDHDLKETEFLKMTRIFQAHSSEHVISAASRRSLYSERNAKETTKIFQDTVSQLLDEDDSLRNSQQIDFLHHSDEFSLHDCSARNCYGFSADVTNILRFVRALRCKGSHIFVINPSLLKNHIVPISATHCGLELVVLTSKSLRYDRSDAISDMRQIFEAVVFYRTEVVVVLSDMHLNRNTWDVFFSAIHWIDSIGHACFDEKWMLEQSRRFADSGICGYTSDETLKNMKSQFTTNFHTIICCGEDTVQIIQGFKRLSSFFQISVLDSTSTQNQVETSNYILNWLQQFRWDNWSSGLCLRTLYNFHSARVFRNNRDAAHPGLSSRLISLLSSLNISYEQLLAVFSSPSIVELRNCSERAIEMLQCAIQFLQWSLQVNSDVGVCPDYVPFSFPNDMSSFCLSIFNVCASTIARSYHAQMLKYSIFPLSCFVSLVIDSIEKHVIFTFNRLLQLEASIRFSFECILIINVLSPALKDALHQQQITSSNLSKFEEEASDAVNEPCSSDIDQDRHAQLLAAAAEATNNAQRLSSMMTFCESHTHISIEEMSSEAFSLTLSILRIVPDTVLQQASLMVGPVVEQQQLLDMLSLMIPMASDFDRLTRLCCKIDFPELPLYNFELTQLLPFHSLVKHSLTWTLDFTKLLHDDEVNEASPSDWKGAISSILTRTSQVSIKDFSAFIQIAAIVNHLGAGPKASPILVLDPLRIFQQAYISLFSIEDVCITSVEEGHNSLAFARSVVTAVRGGLCLIVQGFSCNLSIGFPKLLLNLVDKNFSIEGNGQYCLKLDPDTKAMASVLGIPSTRDISIHPSFSLILVCTGNQSLSPQISRLFKVLSVDASHHALSGIVSNCIFQEQKPAFDRHISSIKSICSNLHLLKQNWESIILDSAQASGNFLYGSFAFKAVSEESIDEGWGSAIDLCLRDSNSLINQEGLKLRVQHKLQKDQISVTIQEFCKMNDKLKVLYNIAIDIAHTLAFAIKRCSHECHPINLSACFDRVISSAHEFRSSYVSRSRTTSEKGHQQGFKLVSGQNVHFDDNDQSSSSFQHGHDSTTFNLSHLGAALLDYIQMSIHHFMAASLSESQRLSLSLYCALRKAKSAGYMSDDEWLVLTSSDDHLQESWTMSPESVHDISVLASASSFSKIQRELAPAVFRIKGMLIQPSIRLWLEAISNSTKAGTSLQKHSNLLPSDLKLHGLHLIAARVHAPQLFSRCIQEFAQHQYLQVPSPMHIVHEDQLIFSCASIQATVLCTTMPHYFFKSSLLQLCPHCRSAEGARGCVHFLIFDCKLFEGVDDSSKLDAFEQDSSDTSSSEVVAMPGFPPGRLQSALVSTISDAVASGKGLIVLHATQILQYWQGYLRHSSFVNSSNSNKLSHLILVCDSKTPASSIQAVDAWSRVVFWNFPTTCECSDAFCTGAQWLLRDMKQQVLDSKKFMVEILTEGSAAFSFQERLFVRITACLTALTLAIHTRSRLQSGFLNSQELFDPQLFFNHSLFVAVSMTKCTGFCDTKAAFIAHGMPWLRQHVVLGRGLQLSAASDTALIFSIFDALINPAIVDEDFTLPFLDAGIFPSLGTAAELTLVLSSIAQRRNHVLEALPSISLLNMQDWNTLRYNWIQGLLLSCAIEDRKDIAFSASPQTFLSTSEIMQSLQHVLAALPSIDSSLLDSHNKHDYGCGTHPFMITVVSEVRLFNAALKQMRTLICSIYESLLRRSMLSSEEENDLHSLKRSNAAERWRKLFGFSRMMHVSEFITCINGIAAFWSSWPAHACADIPVLHANCYRNFGRVLHFLALQQATATGCTLSDIKCVVLPNANQFSGAENTIRVQGLIGRGFGWNGKVAVPISDLHADSEECTHPKRHHQHAASDIFKRRGREQLVPLGEVSILAMSPRELQEGFPFSAAKLHSMPVLRDGFDPHEPDKAQLIWFLFNNQPRTNNMCVFS